MRTVVLALLTAALAGCSALSGCSGGSGEERREPSLEKIPVVRDARDVGLPLDAYMLPDQDRGLVGKAKKVLEIRCMRQRGFTWSMASPGINSSAPLTTRTIEYLDPAVAVRLGYHPATAGSSSKTRPAHTVANPAAMAALLGSNGCSAEASRRFDATFPKLPVDARLLAGEADRSVRADSRFTAVNDRWVTCMKARGYSYPSPWHAARDGRWGSRSVYGDYRNPPTQPEILTARADAECRQSTNLMGMWLALGTAYQKAIIARQESRLVESRRVLDSWRKNALQLIAAG